MSDNIALPQENIAEIETERSKKVVEIDKKEKEKDKAEEDQQFVIDGAILECNMCMVPIGTMKVNFDTPTIQNKKTATVKEKSALSLKFSGNCLKSPYQASPCMAVMQLGEWQNVGTTLVQDQKPLIKKSTIMCNYGGSTIKITKSGQLNVPTIIEQVHKKTINVPDYVVVFRRLASYDGGFGFDWMREDYLTGTCIEELEDLKKIYTPFNIETKNIKTNANFGSYYVPWISIFPNHKSVVGNDVELLIKAPLEFIKDSTDTKAEIMTFESTSPNIIITPNKMTIDECNSTGKIKIECIGKLTKNEIIKVKSSTGAVVGKLNILRNDNTDKLKTEITIVKVLRKNSKVNDNTRIEDGIDEGSTFGSKTDDILKDLVKLENHLNKQSINQALIQTSIYKEDNKYKIYDLVIDESNKILINNTSGEKVFADDITIDNLKIEFKKQFKDAYNRRGLVVFLAPLRGEKAGGEGELYNYNDKHCVIYSLNLKDLLSYSHELMHVLGLQHTFYETGEQKNSQEITTTNNRIKDNKKYIKEANEYIESQRIQIKEVQNNLINPVYASYYASNPEAKRKAEEFIKNEKLKITRYEKGIIEAKGNIKNDENNIKIYQDNKFKFLKKKTDNIMDYSTFTNSTYKWQWEILQKDVINYYNIK